jgi:hypothetical protein
MYKMHQSGNVNARPNFVSFVILIDVIVKSGEKGSAQLAENVLRRMYEQYQDGNDHLKPNALLITKVMSSYTQ